MLARQRVALGLHAPALRTLSEHGVPCEEVLVLAVDKGVPHEVHVLASERRVIPPAGIDVHYPQHSRPAERCAVGVSEIPRLVFEEGCGEKARNSALLVRTALSRRTAGCDSQSPCRGR